MKTKKDILVTAIEAMILAIVMMFAAHITFAQARFGFEIRPGINFPVRDLADAKLRTGFGIEGVLSYQVLTNFGVYAGWGWNQFHSRESFAGPDVDFEETGYTYGLQFMHGIGRSNVSILGRAGILSNHIEVEDASGKIIGDSGHGFREGIGWQVEARVAWPLGEKWILVPSLRYRSLPREIRIGAADTDVVLSYISLGAGIARIF